MGQLAQKQGTSADVRSFGQMLEKDHSDANQKATAVANSVGMTPPTSPNKKQKADYDKMSKFSGAKFDKEFATHMVADHKKDIKEYEKAAKKQDAVGNYAKETLPALRKHLETAQFFKNPLLNVTVDNHIGDLATELELQHPDLGVVDSEKIAREAVAERSGTSSEAH